MSLTTPRKIRDLQIKLYRKAKNEPEFRFYQLYDKVYREDILNHAYALARANHGAGPEAKTRWCPYPMTRSAVLFARGQGVDGKSFEDIESEGLAEWINGLGEDLRNK